MRNNQLRFLDLLTASQMYRECQEFRQAIDDLASPCTTIRSRRVGFHPQFDDQWCFLPRVQRQEDVSDTCRTFSRPNAPVYSGFPPGSAKVRLRAGNHHQEPRHPCVRDFDTTRVLSPRFTRRRRARTGATVPWTILLHRAERSTDGAFEREIRLARQ